MNGIQNVDSANVPKKEALNTELESKLGLKVDVEIINQNDGVGIKEGKIQSLSINEKIIPSLENNKKETQSEIKSIYNKNIEQNVNSQLNNVKKNNQIEKIERTDLSQRNKNQTYNEMKDKNINGDKKSELSREASKLEYSRSPFEDNNPIKDKNNLTEQKIKNPGKNKLTKGKVQTKKYISSSNKKEKVEEKGKTPEKMNKLYKQFMSNKEFEPIISSKSKEIISENINFKMNVYDRLTYDFKRKLSLGNPNFSLYRSPNIHSKEKPNEEALNSIPYRIDNLLEQRKGSLTRIHNNDTWERLYDDGMESKREKNHSNKKKLQNKMKEEIKELKEKPEVNEKSNQIFQNLKSKTHFKSIYEYEMQKLRESNMKNELLKMNLRSSGTEDLTFTPKINPDFNFRIQEQHENPEDSKNLEDSQNPKKQENEFSTNKNLNIFDVLYHDSTRRNEQMKTYETLILDKECTFNPILSQNSPIPFPKLINDIPFIKRMEVQQEMAKNKKVLKEKEIYDKIMDKTILKAQLNQSSPYKHSSKSKINTINSNEKVENTIHDNQSSNIKPQSRSPNIEKSRLKSEQLLEKMKLASFVKLYDKIKTKEGKVDNFTLKNSSQLSDIPQNIIKIYIKFFETFTHNNDKNLELSKNEFTSLSLKFYEKLPISEKNEILRLGKYEDSKSLLFNTFTFEPLLCKNSIKIVEKKGRTNQNIYDNFNKQIQNSHCINDKKSSQKYIDQISECTFNPAIINSGIKATNECMTKIAQLSHNE